MEQWEIDKEFATYYYQKFAPEVLSKFFGQGELISIEDKTQLQTEFGRFCQLVDTLGGIDYYYRIAASSSRPQRMIGIASRVMFGKDWKAFTVRYKRKSGEITEFQKTLCALKDSTVHPNFVSSMYVTEKESKKGSLLSLAMCKTKDLYKVFESIGTERLTKNYLIEWTKRGGNCDFISLPWSVYKENGGMLVTHEGGK